MAEETSALLTTEQLAELLQKTPGAIHHMRHRGEAPPAIRLGRRSLRFRRSDVESWLERQAESPQAS